MSDTETEDEPEAAPTAETDREDIPESVPDDWLDQKPFDPAGR
jgi:hypothetical protein